VAGVPCSRASVGDLIRIDQPDCGATLEHRVPDMGNLISAPKWAIYSIGGGVGAEQCACPEANSPTAEEDVAESEAQVLRAAF
jgi:hypothetical protein